MDLIVGCHALQLIAYNFTLKYFLCFKVTYTIMANRQKKQNMTAYLGKRMEILQNMHWNMMEKIVHRSFWRECVSLDWCICCHIAPFHKLVVFKEVEENQHSEIGEIGK